MANNLKESQKIIEDRKPNVKKKEKYNKNKFKISLY